MARFVDAHVHIWTDDVARYPRAAEERDYSPRRFTPADLFAHSKPAGVARIVLIQMSFYRFDNSYMLEAMRTHPGVFGGVGIVDHRGADPAREMKKLAAQGVRGFRLVGGNDFALPGIEAMWRAGAEQNLAMCMLLGPEALPALDRMCERFPRTPVVIDHFARIGADGTIRDADIRALSALARHPLVKVKASAFYALGRKQAPYTDLKPLFRRVFEDFGPRRVMWASDCPFQVENGHQYAPSLALITEQMPFLSAEDRDWVLRRTAEATFFRR